AVDARQKALLQEMVEKRDRLGRKNGKGFYEYPQNGPKRLWPGLEERQPTRLSRPHIDNHPGLVDQATRRPPAMPALEARRILAEGVITDVREGDVGSILAFGFAPFTGGTLSYIAMMGTKRFVALCKALEKKHGPRFKPSKLLLEMAAKNETFYRRFAPARRQEAA